MKDFVLFLISVIVLLFSMFVIVNLETTKDTQEISIEEIWPHEDLVCYKHRNKIISCERFKAFYE